MSRLPELRPQDIADFDVWWESEPGLWVGKHVHSDKTIEATTLRNLEIQACAHRILHEWRQPA
ncbi:hypothetical protein [Nonomuraea jabiensis]|uniref:hypothetical protein n=1 Tax=Nonomuraea jabiensis TaxID=882448 RepID=UPI003D736929